MSNRYIQEQEKLEQERREKQLQIEREYAKRSISNSLQALDSDRSKNIFAKLGSGRVTEILHAAEELHFGFFGVSNEELRNLIISDESLLNKCDLDTRWGLLCECSDPHDILKILGSPDIISQAPKDILAFAVANGGMPVWLKIKEAGRIHFEETRLLNQMAKHVDIALDIISSDENIRIITSSDAPSSFYNHEEVALALINNPLFLELAPPSFLADICLKHESCAHIIWEKRSELSASLGQFNNETREALRQKYAFWTMENLPYNSSDLSKIARSESRLRGAIQENPAVLLVQDEHQNTLLHHVARSGYFLSTLYRQASHIRRIFPVLDILFSANSDLPFNVQNEEGNTPLHILAQCVDNEVASRYLLPAFIYEGIDRGADFTIRNNAGLTFYDILRTAIEERREYFSQRNRRNPILSLFLQEQNPMVPQLRGEEDFLAALGESFVQPQPVAQRMELSSRDILNVNEFLKAELISSHGEFGDALRKLPLEEQLIFINYLIQKKSGKESFVEDSNLEERIAEYDAYGVLGSLEDAIKIITRQHVARPTDEQVQQINENFLIQLREMADELKNKIEEKNRMEEGGSSSNSHQTMLENLIRLLVEQRNIVFSGQENASPHHFSPSNPVLEALNTVLGILQQNEDVLAARDLTDEKIALLLKEPLISIISQALAETEVNGADDFLKRLRDDSGAVISLLSKPHSSKSPGLSL